jgi:MoaA/NifB/PqqE/SkfB family radical SAM enzyme
MTESKLWRITLDTNPEACNLACIMCEEHSKFSNYMNNLYQTTGTRRRLMPVEWLENIFIQAQELGVKEIIPSTMGEPLLYKHFEEIIKLCIKYNIKLNLTTNGTFPKRNIFEWAELIVPITTDIKISWNGATKTTAESVMQGIDYEKVINNVKELIKVRNEHFQNTNYYCRITFQLTFMKNNMHELADIIQLAAELDIDRIKGHHLWAHFNEIQDLSFRESKESIKLWNQYVLDAYKVQKKFLKKNGKEILLENIFPLQEKETTEIPENYECPFLDRELWISATGKISPCCAPDEQRKQLGDFGNIQNVSLSKVLNSSTYKQLANNYRNYNLCKTCNMRKPV